MKRIKLFGKEMWIISREEKEQLKNGIKMTYNSANFLCDEIQAMVDEGELAGGNEAGEAFISLLGLVVHGEKMLNRKAFNAMTKILGEA